MKKKRMTSGEPFVWATGIALSCILLMLLTLTGVILCNSIGVFWPSSLMSIEMKNGEKYLGEYIKTQEKSKQAKEQLQLKIGNRELYKLDFKWLTSDEIKTKDVYPKDVFQIERSEYGNYFGFIKEVHDKDNTYTSDIIEKINAFKAIIDERKKDLNQNQYAIDDLNIKSAKLKYKLKLIAYQAKQKGESNNPELFGADALAKEPKLEHIIQEIRANFSLSTHLPNNDEVNNILFDRLHISDEIRELQKNIILISKDLESFKITAHDINGTKSTIELAKTVRIYQPNKMSIFDKSLFYCSKIHEILFDDPREANTEGGLFPAIFGTVMMVVLMSILSFPAGVISGVYLREYAKDGIFVKMVRIAVNNLAGIPSIVYGIFGVGFFIHTVGGSIDSFFYPELDGEPYFKKGGILWASLTLGLLTLPVVIVATEEALSSIPKEVRQGSLALGATNLQTLIKVLLPMASPGILTGFILAMARAAGEVAPLMITGVVKIAPDLPLDSQWPFFHLDRSFMHLGFHIYDVGFQSPNVEAAKPMVYVTATLLLAVVFCMSLLAIWLRNSMKKKYATKSF